MIPEIPGTRIRFVKPETNNPVSNMNAKKDLKLGDIYKLCWIDDSLSCRMIYLIGRIGIAYDSRHFEEVPE